MFMELMHGTAHLASNVPCINTWQAGINIYSYQHTDG